MYYHWDRIIEPILNLIRPKNLVEIGSAEGQNTCKLLEFCVRNDCTLHAIDPAPKFAVNDWQNHYGRHFVFHQTLSLAAISQIDRFDIIFIDGDHNWYTVFEELKLIERRAGELDLPFPFVMLHDIGWPYGRRDLYYDPSTIPERYRHPYACKGLFPGVADLLQAGGMNATSYNAINEKGPRNGVLTAVEDFLEETDQELQLLQIPGFHGLGLLFLSRLWTRNDEMESFLRKWDIQPEVREYIEHVEQSHIRLWARPR